MTFRIIYSSRAQDGMTTAEVEKILEVSRRNNQSLDVTGVLFFVDGEFIQVLEGEEVRVRELYDKIAEDPRHHGIKRLIEEHTDNRYFGQWSMAYAVLDDDDVREIGGTFSLNTVSEFTAYLKRPDSYLGSLFLRLIDRILEN